MDRLRLIAFDGEDLGIIAAHVQDAVLKIGDLNYLPSEKRFVLALNRFVWEKAVDGGSNKSFERRKTVLHFERVFSVQSLALDQNNRDAVLSILTIRHEAGDAETPNAAEFIEIVFAGGATLRLSVECIEAQLTDLAASWETSSRPEHDGEANES